MFPRWLLALTLVVALAVPASAQFYKYRDKSGAIRFTDNLADVPPEQRENLKTYEETKTAVPEDTAGGGEQTTPAEAELEAQRAAAQAKSQELRDRQKALMDEYEALQQDREELARMGGQRASEEEQRAYREKIEALNAKVKAYQERREAYERDVQAHNEEMKSRLQAKTEANP